MLPTLTVYSKEKKEGNEILLYDYQPDLSLTNFKDSITLDINQDGTNDVIFRLGWTSTGGYCYIISINTFCKYAFIMTSYETDSITSSKLNWLAGSCEWLPYFGNKIGLKFTYDNEIYYGWLDGKPYWQNDHINLLIDKYAFCTIPNYPLLWGQTEIKTGKKDYAEVTNLIECSNPVTRLIQVRFKENVPGSLEIYDLQGKLVLQKGLKPEPTNIYLPQNGIYIYKFINEKGNVQTGKIEVK